MLTNEEWHRTAEHAAAAKWGEEHKSWFVFRRFGLPLVAGGLVAAMVGFLAYQAWHGVSSLFSDGPRAGTPSAFWLIGGVLLAATAVAWFPRRSVTLAHVLIIRALVTVLAWLGYISYGIALMAS